MTTKPGVTSRSPRESIDQKDRRDRVLSAIRDDCEAMGPHLAGHAASIAAELQTLPEVYAVKVVRTSADEVVAEVERLIAASPGTVTLANYTAVCADLAVVNVLFVFEAQLRAIHEFVTRTWNLRAAPKASAPPGDPLGIRAMLDGYGGVYTMREDACTGIDYRIESNVFKRPVIATVRVCNAFDSLWRHSEQATGAPAGDKLVAQMIDTARDVGRHIYKKQRESALRRLPSFTDAIGQLKSALTRPGLSGADKAALQALIDTLEGQTTGRSADSLADLAKTASFAVSRIASKTPRAAPPAVVVSEATAAVEFPQQAADGTAPPSAWPFDIEATVSLLKSDADAKGPSATP